MVLDTYMGSNQQLQIPLPEGFAQFLNTVILSQNDASSTLGDSSQSVVQMTQQDTLLVPNDTSISPQNNTTNSRYSTDESSMLTVADSPFSGGSHMPINASNSTVSRTTNCGKLSGHPTRDQCPALQQTFQEGQTYPSCCARQGEQLPTLPVTPQSIPVTPQSMIPAYPASAPLLNFKKPKLEMQQEDTLHAYSQQQLSPSQVPMQSNSHDLMASTKLFYQNLSRYELQNQTPVPAFSPIRRQVQCCPPNQTSVIAKKKLAGITEMNGALCFRRLMHYMKDLRSRPVDNNIDYLRKFVHHYFSPGARRRWCLSNYCNVGSHVHNNISQTTADSWKCDFCGSKLEKGFEATYAVLPRMIKVYFESVIDEILYLDSPVEKTLPSGCIVLWFGKAVQESIYNHFRVVHEGQLRIVFTPELKILSWDFCIQRHEELVSRRSIITQVNYIVDEVTKLQNNSEGVTAQDVQSNCNRVIDNLVTNMIPLAVDEVGFPKRFVRHLQMSDTFNCMKPVMAESRAKNLGPIETLRSYSQETAIMAKSGSQMHGTSSVTNIVTQTPSNAGEQQAMLSPLVYYPHQPVMEEQRMSSNSISSINNLYVPSTSQQLPTVGRQIGDLLACMRSDGCGAGKWESNPAGKRRLVYDPKNFESKPGGKRRLVYDPKNIEQSQFVEFADKAKGKGFNYSSSSNSSAMVKREPESDGDTTSPA